MNRTIEKFGYPQTLLREFRHWCVLLRPAQITLASLIIAAKSEATAFADLDPEAFAEQAQVVHAVEHALRRFTSYERLNYLMLMMVDPNVHFHVIPRYATARTWSGIPFPDFAWPAPPRLENTVTLDREQLQRLTSEVASEFY